MSSDLEKLISHIVNHTTIEIKTGTTRDKFTPIWMVSINNRIFARSWNKSENSWLNTLLNENYGQIQTGEKTYSIYGVKIFPNDPIQRKIDQAYLSKYTQPHNIPYAEGISKVEYHDFTVELFVFPEEFEITISRSNAENIDFIHLLNYLNQDLAQRNGEKNSFFAQFNQLDQLDEVVLAYIGNIPVGCGAIKKYDSTTMEIKRMYVIPAWRGKGIAPKILQELEFATQQLGFTKCILETGLQMPEAIGLYKKSGFKRINNYGPYIDVSDSVCFEKVFN